MTPHEGGARPYLARSANFEERSFARPDHRFHALLLIHVLRDSILPEEFCLRHRHGKQISHTPCGHFPRSNIDFGMQADTGRYDHGPRVLAVFVFYCNSAVSSLYVRPAAGGGCCTLNILRLFYLFFFPARRFGSLLSVNNGRNVIWLGCTRTRIDLNMS